MYLFLALCIFVLMIICFLYSERKLRFTISYGKKEAGNRGRNPAPVKSALKHSSTATSKPLEAEIEAPLDSSKLNPGCKTRSLLQYKAVDTGRRYHHPPLVHYVKLSLTASELNFREYTSVLSVYKFLKPEKILFYTYSDIYGKYWSIIQKFNRTKIELHKVPLLTTIGGKNVYWIQHIADYLKLSKVLKYGRVALDFDVIIINGTKLKQEQSLSECVLAAEVLETKTSYINGGIYSCIKNSKFMSAWVKNYDQDYKPRYWVENISYFPQKLLTKKKGCFNIHVDDTMCMSPHWRDRREWLKDNYVN